MAATRLGSLAVVAVGMFGLTACGGGGSSAPAHVVSATQVAACARTAGFKVTTEKFDAAANETAQIGLNTPASISPPNTVTLAFYSDSSSASAFYSAQGGAKNPGSEPGGNDQIGTVVVSYLAKDAWLAKAERCVRAAHS